MGFVSKTFGTDPSSQWHRDPGLGLAVDLSEPSFCGFRLGHPVTALARLGAPENKNATRDGIYRYDSESFEVDASGEKIGAFTFLWEARDGGGHPDFVGLFTYQGGPLDLNSETSEADFVRRFGKPYWRDQDDEETIHFYEFGEIEWQAEFRLDGTLKALTILTPPSLADPTQRESYGVTAEWPPRA